MLSRSASALLRRTAGAQIRASSSLKQRLVEIMPQKQAELKALKKDHANVVIGEVTVDQAIGGARDVKCMLWDTSLLDAQEGIRFRGHTIPELQKVLPKFPGGQEPIPEGLLWLLLTGEVPTAQQAASITSDLHARARLPEWVEEMIRNFPKDLHPMSQLSMAIMALQKDSKFFKGYQEGIPKSKYWELTLDDSLDLLANLPKVAALIYRNTYFDGNLGHTQPGLDYSANFCRLMGHNDPEFDELMRMYLTIHSDHEGGNASAHTTHLVGSTLADPYLSLAAGLNALAGPLHGRANQDVLTWILELQALFKSRGKPVNKDSITEFAWETLNAGQVIPGYGHAVLRQTDPRYTCQREFALRYMPKDELFNIVSTIYEVMPDILTKHGKTKNPYPNVDSHSGVLLMHYGFTQHDFYTVLFGVSRAYGVLSQLFWDRALGLPLERPKSITTKWLQDFCNKKAAKK